MLIKENALIFALMLNTKAKILATTHDNKVCLLVYFIFDLFLSQR